MKNGHKKFFSIEGRGGEGYYLKIFNSLDPVTLEYEIEPNPNKNGSRMTKVLIDLVSRILESFGANCKDVISLDSSSASKFSKHLVFRYVINC